MNAKATVWRATVEYMLDNYQFNDAVFLAERLYNNDKSASNGHLLATCYYRSSCVHQARLMCSHYLHESHKCLLLYVRCCLDLKMYREGITHLQGLFQVNGKKDYTTLKSKFGEDVGVAYCLLGDLNRRMNFNEQACKMYQLALQFNPLMWSAFESLCQMGRASGNVEEHFSCNSAEVPAFLQLKLNSKQSVQYAPSINPNNSELFKTGLMESSTPAPLPQAPPTSQLPSGARHPLLSFDNSKGLGGVAYTPFSTPPGVLDFSPSNTPQLPPRPPNGRGQNRLANSSLVTRQCVFTSNATPMTNPLDMADVITPIQQTMKDGNFNMHTTTGQSTPVQEEQPMAQNAPPRTANLRRSARLGGGGKSPSSMSISRHRSEIMPLAQARTKGRCKSAKSPITKKRVKIQPKLSPTKPQENEDPAYQRGEGEGGRIEEKMDTAAPGNKDNDLMTILRDILTVLTMFGQTYKHLQNYRLQEAVTALHSLPPQYKDSCWVLTHLGHAMMAKEDFHKAAKYYGRVHLADPYRQEGMDQYAAALWHLQKVTELSELAEDLQSSNKTRPEGLCALSSLMNLYKEHEAAILYLERAVQLSPRYVYAQTLLGLEHILIKDYDKAYAAFQSATSINPRHFNAWYGMGHLFLKQEKWSMAEVFSRKAIRINPSSSVACTQLALILQHQGKLQPALKRVEHAISLNSANNLPKYHRALILESLEEYNEALKQLQELTSSLPREPLFYKVMGRILVKLGRPHEGVVHLSWGLDYAHSARCMIGGGGVAMMDRGDLGELIETLPGLNEDDFVVHSDDDNFDS